MKRRRNKRRKSRRFSLIKFLLIIIIIFGVILIKNSKQNSNKDQIEDKEMISDNNELKQEEIIETAVEEEKTSKEDENINLLNNLKNTEPSFGKLDVPVYKKGEKNIKIPLIIYHAFQTPVPSDDKYKLFSTEEKFEENVTTLLNAGYTFITLEDVYKYNKGNIGLPEKNVTITMDDGWLGDYTEAFKVLKKYNVPATIFIVEELVGTGGYFTWEQAKEMYDTGLVKIHVHARKHINATEYGKKKLIEDYNHTHELIEEKLGAKVQKIMAYPAGKSSPDTIKWLKEAGFEVQVQTKYGTVNKSNKLDLTGLGRIRGEKATGKSLLNSIENKK